MKCFHEYFCSRAWVFLVWIPRTWGVCGGDDACLIVHRHFPPPSHNSVLANSHQILQEVKVSKTIKFLQLFLLLLLLNSTGRGGESHELLLTLRGKRQPSSALGSSPWRWLAVSPTSASRALWQPLPRCRPAWQDVEKGWAVEGHQREDGAGVDKCRRMVEHKSYSLFFVMCC